MNGKEMNDLMTAESFNGYKSFVVVCNNYF